MAAPASRAQAGWSSASAVLQIAAAPAPGPGGPGRSPARRHAASQLDLRVSDAERSEVADQLSQHFGTGRLDEPEFSERLHQVMAATTYRDLGGVLQDLPGSVVPSALAPPVPPARPARAARPRRGRALLRFALIVLLVLFAAAAAHAVAWVLAPVLWIGLLCAIAVLAARARARR